MNQPAKRVRRKEILSSPGFQLRIVLVFGIVAVLFIATNYFVGWYLLVELDKDLMRLPLDVRNRADVAILMSQHGNTLMTQLAIFSFLCIFILLTGSVLLSHRIAGPLHQLRQYLIGMTEGSVKPRRIRFRKHDFFLELADRFNDFQKARGLLADDHADAGQSDAAHGSGERP